jgi:hypothetical protein
MKKEILSYSFLLLFLSSIFFTVSSFYFESFQFLKYSNQVAMEVNENNSETKKTNESKEENEKEDKIEDAVINCFQLLSKSLIYIPKNAAYQNEISFYDITTEYIAPPPEMVY